MTIPTGAGEGGGPGPVERRAARDASIVELRLRGFSYQEIADRVGCSVGTAHRVAKKEGERSSAT